VNTRKYAGASQIRKVWLTNTLRHLGCDCRLEIYGAKKDGKSQSQNTLLVDMHNL